MEIKFDHNDLTSNQIFMLLLFLPKIIGIILLLELAHSTHIVVQRNVYIYFYLDGDFLLLSWIDKNRVHNWSLDFLNHPKLIVGKQYCQRSNEYFIWPFNLVQNPYKIIGRYSLFCRCPFSLCVIASILK